jgi:hypothetical protein
MKEFSVAQWEEFVRRYEMGETSHELAVEMDCAATTARRHLAKWGAVIRPSGPKKGVNYAKLKAEKEKKSLLDSNRPDRPVEVTPTPSRPKRKIISIETTEDW